MNVVSEILRINNAELESGTVGTPASWHAKYAGSAWVFVGNLPIRLTEGDIVCILSQYGEVEDINLVRDEETGRSRGFAFIKYEDPRSCVLAVDNFTGTKILGRTLRVDHVEKYRLPRHLLEKEEAQAEQGDAKDSNKRTDPGHAYRGKELASQYSINEGQDLFAEKYTPAQEARADGREREQAKKKEVSKETKKLQKEAKRKRKEERAERRRHREERREEREERQRERRAKRFRHEDFEEYDADASHQTKASKSRRKAERRK